MARAGGKAAISDEVEARHVVRTLRALELLALRPRSQAELARELGVHPRTARRLLGRLQAEGYVARENKGRPEFAATLKIVALAGHVIDRTDIVRTALPFVSRLRAETGEGAYLSIPGDDAVMHLVHEPAENVVMVKPRLGEQAPYHATAFGKALLAHLPERLEYVLGCSLERWTPYTIVESADLLIELATVRERGYATDDRENSLDVRSVAASVFAHSGDAVAALGVSAPATRLSAQDLPRVGALVAEAALSLSAALGFDPRSRSPEP